MLRPAGAEVTSHADARGNQQSKPQIKMLRPRVGDEGDEPDGREEISNAVPCARNWSMRKRYIKAGMTKAPPVPVMPTRTPTTVPTRSCSSTLRLIRPRENRRIPARRIVSEGRGLSGMDRLNLQAIPKRERIRMAVGLN